MRWRRTAHLPERWPTIAARPGPRPPCSANSTTWPRSWPSMPWSSRRPDGQIVASAGPRRAAWPVASTGAHRRSSPASPTPSDEVVARPSARFRVSARRPQRAERDRSATSTSRVALDDAFAAQMSTMLRVPVSVIVGGDVIGSTLSLRSAAPSYARRTVCRATGRWNWRTSRIRCGV